MKQLKTYLENPERDYQTGVEIYKRLENKMSYTLFFVKNKNSKPGSQAFNMLMSRLKRIARIKNLVIVKRKTAPVPEGIKEKPDAPASPPPVPPVKEPTQPPMGEVQQLTRKKETTNKLLSFDWDELNEREKAYFNYDSSMFEQKKQMLKQVAELERDMKALHLAIKKAEGDEERKGIAQKLASAEDEQFGLYEQIDLFSEVSEKKANDDNRAVLISERNNLRSKISKIKKQLEQEPEHKQTEKRQQRLKESETRLTKIETSLNE